MPLDEPTFDWQTTPDALIVRFPAPSSDRCSMGCAIAFLMAAALLVLAVLVLILWRLAEDGPTSPMHWVVYGVVTIMTLCLLWYAATAFHDARLPPEPLEPGVLWVKDGILKIERAGRDRDMDYSWELCEIADVRLGVAAPDRIFLSIKSLLAQTLFPDDLICISVERQSGEVDYVLVAAPGKYWPDALEARLRPHLGLCAPVGATTTANDEA